MSQFSDNQGNEGIGPVYVRENSRLFLAGSHCAQIKAPPLRLFSKGFSVELCVKQDDTCKPKEKPFIFTYTKQGSLRYSAKPLFTLALDLIADNVQHVDSLLGFPEQVAERLFTAAEARQQFCHPQSGLVALRKFTEAYGDLMLSSLCLRGKYLLVSEKLEEIKLFHGLHSLDLSCCKLGDDHELLEHLSSDAMYSLRELYLKDNCLSDIGVRKLTAPVRVLRRGLGKLTLLDMSCNPEITEKGVTFLLVFKQLMFLDISDTGVQDRIATCKKIQTSTGLVHSKTLLTQFDHVDCRTQGWAEQVAILLCLGYTLMLLAYHPSAEAVSVLYRRLQYIHNTLYRIDLGCLMSVSLFTFSFFVSGIRQYGLPSNQRKSPNPEQQLSNSMERTR
ncbi:leucine-rich repeat-containing protein 42 isoform X2 [Eleutherodactylus coqui]|uniref:leucine-rich repeat-containing protein 42 isoform X2 n=1 Tax=Eleutherodactylus coqui TaxID=57060 RepID=UPI0034637C92